MSSPTSGYGTPLPGYGTSMVDRINLYLQFKRYYKLVRDRWLLLLAFTLIGGLIASWVAWITPNRFKSNSVITITPKLRASPTAFADNGGNFADMQVQSLLNPVMHGKVMAKVAESLGISNSVTRPKFEAFASKGNSFYMVVTATNWDYAKKCAEAWTQEFLDTKRQQKARMVNTGEATTKSEIMEYDRRYSDARAETDEFRKRYQIATDSDAGAAVQLRLEQSKEAFENLQIQRKLFEGATVEQLASGAMTGIEKSGIAGDRQKSTPEAGNNSSEAARKQDSMAASDKFAAGARYTEMKTAIELKSNEIQEQSKKLKPAHPFMEKLHKDLSQLNIELKTVLGQVDEMRKAQIATLRMREDNYPKIIEDLKEKVAETGKIQSEYRSLREKEAFIKEQLDSLKRQLQTFGRAGVDEDDFSIEYMGGGTGEKDSPNRPLMVVTGILMGLMSGLGVVYLLHRMDDRLDLPEKIEEVLEEPVMGQIPEVDKKNYKEGQLLLSRMKAHTMFAEALRGVRSALLLSPEGASKRMLAVTSAIPGDGKTTFTTNFAVTLANAGHRTLLIDADLRRGNIHGYFEQPQDGGLTEVLQGRKTWRETIRDTGIKNLFLMSSGEFPNNPSELLLGARTKELIKELRQEFDYVIFDCPPLTAIDDTFSIAAYLDGLFFVVRAGRTSMRFAKLGINTIRQRGAPILGLVVNGVPIDNPYYYYTTYYYSSYYQKPVDDRAELANSEDEKARSSRPMDIRDDGRLLQEPRRIDSTASDSNNTHRKEDLQDPRSSKN